MKIMMLLMSYDFPPDIRVEKEIRALLPAGHQIVLVCENRKQRPPREQWQGIDIIRLKAQPRWWRQLNTGLLFVALRNPIWERQIKQIVAQERPDVIHVHDLPFVGPAIRIARHFELPLVADLHENHPAHMATLRKSGRNLYQKISFNPERFEQYERQVLPQCTRVITVVEEAAERVQSLGISAERIVVVSNTEDIDHSVSECRANPLPSSGMNLLYVGGLQANRGLEIAIEAMPIICKEIPSARLIIVGDGIYRHALEMLREHLHLEQIVQFEGWQPFEKVHGYIEQGDLCLVPHTESPEINTTIPHKLFQYMYMAKPVLVSSAKPLARIVQQSKAGAVFQSGSAASFAQEVLSLQDVEKRIQLGQNGHQAVVTQYNWRQDGQRLVQLYSALS